MEMSSKDRALSSSSSGSSSSGSSSSGSSSDSSHAPAAKITSFKKNKEKKMGKGKKKDTKKSSTGGLSGLSGLLDKYLNLRDGGKQTEDRATDSTASKVDDVPSNSSLTGNATLKSFENDKLAEQAAKVDENLQTEDVGKVLEVREQTLILSQGGKKYEIDRFCPHKHVDFADRSELMPGHIKCLKHKYVFRLTDGVCITNDKGCVLKVKELEW